MRIDGRKIAEGIYEGLKYLPIPQRRMIAVLVGGDKASASFLARKAAAAQSLGIGFEIVSFSGIELEEDIARSITLFAKDSLVGGIVLQLPVPAAYNRDVLIRAIGIVKDVDNLSGQASVLPPAVLTVQAVLASCGKKIFDYNSIRIVGNGFLVGAPIARFCGQIGIPYEIANSKTENLESFVRGGDLVIGGVGKASLLNADWLRGGAGAIDFGFPPDFSQELLAQNGGRLAFYTPTPYGTGPILIAKLLENFYFLNRG